MPFDLIDPTKEQTFTTTGGASFTYREATCDDVEEAMERASDDLGRVDRKALRRELITGHVTGWGGFRLDGEDFPYDPDEMTTLLGRLPFDIVRSLVERIEVVHREGVESGKGSDNGSGG